MKRLSQTQPDWHVPGSSSLAPVANPSASPFMSAPKFDDKPAGYPTSQIGGAPPKGLTQVLLDRRATSHFRPDPVPSEYLETILKFGAQAPSGYNLQPWRFIVVRELEARRRLQKAAMDQGKISEAPVVIIAFGVPGEWRKDLDAVVAEGTRRGQGSPKDAESVKEGATQFLQGFQPAVWLNRHTMIAFTTMMLVAESYGLDTAPMEGFDPTAVKEAFELPAEAEVVALLAIGFGKEPDRPYGGRFALSEFVFSERYGQRWSGAG